METRSIPLDNIAIAWATPVSLAQLGARLETYAETKSAITTFRLAARKHLLATCHILLPEEIISIIASKVRDAVFEPKMESWTKMSRCLTNNCTTVSHMSQSGLESTKDMSEERLENQWNSSAEDDHQEHVREYCYKLSHLDGKSSTLAKCVQIFARDFGIRPYFMVQKFHESSTDSQERAFIDSVRAKAFLTLPLVLEPITYDTSPGDVSLSVCKTIPPSLLHGQGDERLRRFSAAMNVLSLRPCGLKEEEVSLGEDDDEDEMHGLSDEWPQLMMLGYGECWSWDYGFW